MELYKSNSFQHWKFFAMNNQEELYKVIDSMIKDTVKEIAPQIIKDYLRENLNTDYIVKMFIDGKGINISHIKDEIIEYIIRQI